VWFLKPVFLATQEMEIRKIIVPDQLVEKSCQDSILTNKKLGT
jgi:hypothetical protein